MKKVVERNPVIDKPLMNNIMIALYAFIVFSYMVTIADILIKFPLNSHVVDFSDIQILAVNLAGLIIQTAVFLYGLLNALKGMLSPKRMGIVISVFFASVCLANSNRIFGNAAWQLMFLSILLILPSMAGAIASYLYFITAKAGKLCTAIIYAASSWGIIRIILNQYMMIRYAEQFVSMNTALNLLLNICIYFLIMYQTNTLGRKRKKAIEMNL